MKLATDHLDRKAGYARGKSSRPEPGMSMNMDIMQINTLNHNCSTFTINF